MHFGNGKVKRRLNFSQAEEPSFKRNRVDTSSGASSNNHNFVPRSKWDNGVLTGKHDTSSTSISYTKLPTEIWLQICRLVVEDEAPISARTRLVDLDAKHMSERRTILSLASTCRWMYRLATPIYYSKNTFSILRHSHNFFASIGPINTNLITSLTFSNKTSHSFNRLSWQQISAMTAIKDISTFYDEECTCSMWVHFAGEIQTPNYNAVVDYSEFIGALSDSSSQEEDRSRKITWACADIPGWGRGDLLDQCSWMSLEFSDVERSSMTVMYTWGTLKAFLRYYSMNIHVERHGRVTA